MAKWRDLNLDEMYQVVIKENDEALEWQVHGWAGMAEVYNEQWSRLWDYKQAILQNWDSPGGRAYAAEIDKVMTTLNEAATKASGNATALNSVGNMIGATQRALYELLKEFDSGPLAKAKKDAEEEAEEWHDDLPFAGDTETVNRNDVLESSGYNDKGRSWMDALVTEIQTKWRSDIWAPDPYQGPRDSAMPTRGGMPPVPTPGSPKAPAAPPPPSAPMQ
ncbi:MAG: hypothetical protein ACRDT4_18920, partial [Micromonosporaceae bacterium]